jgi:cytochrome b561
MTSTRWASGGARGYNTAAITLHWLIAACIVVQVLLGWWMNEWVPDHSPIQDQIQTVHISLGITIFLLVLVRIAIRLIWPPPPIPASTPGWAKVLAMASHTIFYFLMVLLPFTGWLMVSMGNHPIYWWGIPWPHLPFVHQVFGEHPTKAAHHLVMHTHVFILIWILVLNLALHIGAAIWHQVVGPPVFWRMLPGGKPPSGLA